MPIMHSYTCILNDLAKELSTLEEELTKGFDKHDEPFVQAIDRAHHHSMYKDRHTTPERLWERSCTYHPKGK